MAEQLFAGKVALVTGAGHGIGRAEALALARYGARVVVNDLQRGEPTSAEQVAADIRGAGGEAVAACGSVSRPDDADRIVGTAFDAFGRLDILVNNAGFGRVAPVWEMEDKDWEAVIAVNLTGTFLMTRAAAQVMRRQQSGVIVNTASEAATGDTYFSAYAAAKAGVVGFTRGVARDLMREGIRCNAITPRAFDTAQTDEGTWAEIHAFADRYGTGLCGPHPMGPIPGKAAEVAEIVAWLCSDAAADLTGRVLVAGCGEVGLWEEPTVGSPLICMDGWTVERLNRVRRHLLRRATHPYRDLPAEAWAAIDRRYRGRIGQGQAVRTPAPVSQA